MEKINRKLQSQFLNIKQNLISKINHTNDKTELIQYISNLTFILLTAEDFKKRKRVKNSIPEEDRCAALKADFTQCTRHKREGDIYCGTHIKGRPHGEKKINISSITQRLTITATEIDGIVYYTDEQNNIYDPINVLNNTSQINIIGKIIKNSGKNIIQLNNEKYS